MDKEELKKSVTVNLRCVTQSSKGGVNLNSLQSDYKGLIGKAIPFTELGYPSLESFLQSIPDVVCLKKSKNGQCMVEGVADSSTAHIAKLISQQKNTKNAKKGNSKKPSVPIRKYHESWRSPSNNPEGISKASTSNSSNVKVPLPKPKSTGINTSTDSKQTTHQNNVISQLSNITNSNPSVPALKSKNTGVTNSLEKQNHVKSEQNSIANLKYLRPILKSQNTGVTTPPINPIDMKPVKITKENPLREGTSTSIIDDSSLLRDTSTPPITTSILPTTTKNSQQNNTTSHSLKVNSVSEELLQNLNSFYSTLYNAIIIIQEGNERLENSSEVPLSKSQRRNLRKRIRTTEKLICKTVVGMNKNIDTVISYKEKSESSLLNEIQVPDSCNILAAENEDLKNKLENEKEFNMNFSSQIVRLHSLVKIEQDSLKFEREKVKKLEKQLKSAQVAAANERTQSALESSVNPKEIEDLKRKLETEKKINKDFSSQMVRLHSLVKIGQDSLTVEEEKVKKLEKQLKAAQLTKSPSIQKKHLKKLATMSVQNALLSSKDWVLLDNFRSDYKNLFGIPIPYQELNYNSLEAFIQDIPDVINLKMKKDGQIYIQAVKDEKAADISSEFFNQCAMEATIPPPVAPATVLPLFRQIEPSCSNFQSSTVTNAAHKPTLGGFPNIKCSLASAKLSSLLMMNILLFGDDSYMETLKRGILSFDGFDFCEGSDKWKEREILYSMLSEDALRECLKLLFIDCMSCNKKELVNKLLQFLASPGSAYSNNNVDKKIPEEDFMKENIEINNEASGSSNNCPLKTVQQIQEYIHNNELKTGAKTD